VPSLGVSVAQSGGVYRVGGLERHVTLWSLAGTFELEWSTDWIAILGGVSLPIGWDERGVVDGANSNSSTLLQPWTVGLGVTVSPF
jgi:hypothetical protein